MVCAHKEEASTTLIDCRQEGITAGQEIKHFQRETIWSQCSCQNGRKVNKQYGGEKFLRHPDLPLKSKERLVAFHGTPHGDSRGDPWWWWWYYMKKPIGVLPPWNSPEYRRTFHRILTHDIPRNSTAGPHIYIILFMLRNSMEVHGTFHSLLYCGKNSVELSIEFLEKFMALRGSFRPYVESRGKSSFSTEYHLFWRRTKHRLPTGTTMYILYGWITTYRRHSRRRQLKISHQLHYFGWERDLGNILPRSLSVWTGLNSLSARVSPGITQQTANRKRNSCCCCTTTACEQSDDCWRTVYHITTIIHSTLVYLRMHTCCMYVRAWTIYYIGRNPYAAFYKYNKRGNNSNYLCACCISASMWSKAVAKLTNNVINHNRYYCPTVTGRQWYQACNSTEGAIPTSIPWRASSRLWQSWSLCSTTTTRR